MCLLSNFGGHRSYDSEDSNRLLYISELAKLTTSLYYIGKSTMVYRNWRQQNFATHFKATTNFRS